MSRSLLTRPAVSAVVFLVVGIFLHGVVPSAPLILLGLLCGLIAASCWCEFHGRRSTILVAAAIICAGTLVAQMTAYQFAADQIGLFATDDPQLAEVELEFLETPRLIEAGGQGHRPGRQMGPASVTAIKTWDGWQPASGSVLFSVGSEDPRIIAGQKVRATGMLQRLSPAMNPGQFDWDRYYRRQRVLASIRVNHSFDVTVMSSPSSPALAKARTGIRQRLAKGFSPTQQSDLALLQALMLGDRGPGIRDTERDFQKTGTSHLLASSGVRMAVLGGIVYFICRLLRLRPRLSAGVVALGAVSWGVLLMPSPQAMRPVVIAATLGIGLAGRRTVDRIQLLAFAALAILVVEPLDIYGAGFQFSFIIVLGMLVLTRPFMSSLLQFRNQDQLVLDRFREATPSRRVKQWIIHHILRAVTAAAIAWVVSLPLVAYHFEQFTPWAMPLSIVLSPLVLAALILGFLKLALTILVPPLAPVWATIASCPVALLRWAMAHAAHLPGADIPVSQPPVWAMVLFYVLICLPLFPVTRRALRWGVRCGPVGAFVLLMAMPWLFGFARESTSTGTVRVTLLSVGAGQCAVVELPGHKVVMVDAGSTTLMDPLHLCIGPFLHHEGQGSINSIYLSHGDFDHISATEGAWDEYGVGEVVTTPYFRRHAYESVPCRFLLEMLDESGHPPREVVAGAVFDWGDGASAEVLWPPKQCKMNSNNAGMVLRLTYGGKSVLFPADIQDPAMRELLRNPGKLKSDVLVAPHHGSSESLTADFVRAVDPEIIVSSNAARLTKKQRDFEHIIERRPLYRTSLCGAIEIDLEKVGRVQVKPFVERKQRGMVIERDGTTHVAR